VCVVLLPLHQASDEFGSLLVLTAKHKLRSFAFSPAAHRGATPTTTAQLALGLTNNSVEVRGGGQEVGGGGVRGGSGGDKGRGVR